MLAEDIAACRSAIALACSGNIHEAYERFCVLHSLYPQNVTILYWIAATTPSMEEAMRARADIAHIAPHHTKLAELDAYLARRKRRPPVPVYRAS